VAITNGYSTLAELKASLGITDNVDDTALEAAITAASRMIDDYTERFFYRDGTTQSPVSRYYTPQDITVLMIDDVYQITEVAIDAAFDQTYSTVFATSDYLVEPVNAPRKGWPFTRILATGSYIYPYPLPQSVRVKGIWGWNTVPAEISMATLLQSSRLFARRQSPFGIAGAPDLGVVRLSSRLDADVEVLCRPFRRRKGVAY
jgi:Phage gp6-like head-tail connector protein